MPKGANANYLWDLTSTAMGRGNSRSGSENSRNPSGSLSVVEDHDYPPLLHIPSFHNEDELRKANTIIEECKDSGTLSKYLHDEMIKFQDVLQETTVVNDVDAYLAYQEAFTKIDQELDVALQSMNAYDSEDRRDIDFLRAYFRNSWALKKLGFIEEVIRFSDSKKVSLGVKNFRYRCYSGFLNSASDKVSRTAILGALFCPIRNEYLHKNLEQHKNLYTKISNFIGILDGQTGPDFVEWFKDELGASYEKARDFKRFLEGYDERIENVNDFLKREKEYTELNNGLEQIIAGNSSVSSDYVKLVKSDIDSIWGRKRLKFVKNSLNSDEAKKELRYYCYNGFTKTSADISNRIKELQDIFCVKGNQYKGISACINVSDSSISPNFVEWFGDELKGGMDFYDESRYIRAKKLQQFLENSDLVVQDVDECLYFQAEYEYLDHELDDCSEKWQKAGDKTKASYVDLTRSWLHGLWGQKKIEFMKSAVASEESKKDFIYSCYIGHVSLSVGGDTNLVARSQALELLFSASNHGFLHSNNSGYEQVYANILGYVNVEGKSFLTKFKRWLENSSDNVKSIAQETADFVNSMENHVENVDDCLVKDRKFIGINDRILGISKLGNEVPVECLIYIGFLKYTICELWGKRKLEFITEILSSENSVLEFRHSCYKEVERVDSRSRRLAFLFEESKNLLLVKRKKNKQDRERDLSLYRKAFMITAKEAPLKILQFSTPIFIGPSMSYEERGNVCLKRAMDMYYASCDEWEKLVLFKGVNSLENCTKHELEEAMKDYAKQAYSNLNIAIERLSECKDYSEDEIWKKKADMRNLMAIALYMQGRYVDAKICIMIASGILEKKCEVDDRGHNGKITNPDDTINLKKVKDNVETWEAKIKDKITMPQFLEEHSDNKEQSLDTAENTAICQESEHNNDAGEDSVEYEFVRVDGQIINKSLKTDMVAFSQELALVSRGSDEIGVNALCPDKSIVAENRKDEQEAEVKNSFKPWKSSRPWKWIGLAALGGVCGSGVAVYYGASVLMYGGVGGAAGAFVRGCFEETAIVYKRGPEMERLNRVIAEAFKNYKGKKYMGFLKSLFDIRRGIDITWNDEDKPVAITVNCDDLVTKLLANNFNPDGIASILYLLADALMNVIESFSHMSQEKVKAQIIKILKEITKLKNNKLIDKAKALDEKIRGGLGLDESLGGALSKSVSARVYELQQLALIDLIGMRLKEENIKEAEDCLKSFRQVRQELRVIESDSIKDDLMDYLSETVFGVTVAGDKAGDKSYEAGNSSQHDSDFQIIKSFNVVREKLRVHDYLAATQELNNNKTKGSSLSEFWYLMAESYRHMGSFTLSRMYNAQAISLINVSVKESLKKDLDIQRRYLEVYWLNAEDRLKKYGDIGFSAPSASEIERFYPVFVMDGYDNTAIGQGYRAVSSYEYSLLRNIMFALWISHIETKSQRHFSEVFRVVSGSSMSAIIAAMITVSDKDSEGKLVPKFSGYEILEVCREMYKYYVDNYRRPLSIEYLESKLSEYLGDARLNETLSHVVIPAQKGKELFMFDSKDSNKGNEIILSAIKLKHAVIASIASSPVLDSYSFAESYPLKKDKNKKVAPINEKFEGDGALTSFPVQDVFRLGKFQRDKEMLLLSFGTREDKSEISGLNPKLKYRWEMPLTGIIVGHDKYEYSINKFEMLKMAPIWAGFNFIDDQVINVTDIRYNLLLGHLGIDYDPFFGRKYVEEAVTTRIIRAESDEVLTGELHGYNQKIYFVKGCGEASICDFLQVPLDELSKRMLSYISEEGNITQKKKLLVRSKEDLFAKHFVLNSSREKKVFDDLYKKVGRLSKDFKSHMSSVETQSAFSAEDVQSINSFDNTKERVNMAWTMLVKKNLTTLAEGFSTLVERSKKIYDQIDNFLNNSEVQLEYLVYLLKRGVFREGAVDLFMMAARSVNKILHIWSLEDDNDSSKIVVSETYGRGNSSSVHVLRSESIITPLIECEVSSNTNLLAAEQQPSQENGNSSGACT